MNQNEPIQPSAPIQPKSIPWLWIIFGVVVLAAVGFFGWNYMQKQKVVTPVIEPIATTEITSSISPTTTPAISTASWKTYENKDLGYSVKYPQDWLLDTQAIKENDLFILTKERKDNLDSGKIVRVFDFSVKVYKNISELPNNQVKKLSFQDWIKQEADNFGFTQRKTIALDGVSGFQGISSGEGDSYLIFVEKGSFIYEIETGDTAIPTTTEQKIIDTFQFIK